MCSPPLATLPNFKATQSRDRIQRRVAIGFNAKSPQDSTQRSARREVAKGIIFLASWRLCVNSYWSAGLRVGEFVGRRPQQWVKTVALRAGIDKMWYNAIRDAADSSRKPGLASGCERPRDILTFGPNNAGKSGDAREMEKGGWPVGAVRASCLRDGRECGMQPPQTTSLLPPDFKPS